MLIILFIYTGLSKLMDYSTFRMQLGRSPFLNEMADWIALLLPPAELLIAGSLIFRRSRLSGLYASFFLMALFTGYIFMMLHFSYDLPCSCGGILAKMSWQDHLVFNTVFTALAGIAVIQESGLIRSVLLKLGILLLLAMVILLLLANYNKSPNTRNNGFNRSWMKATLSDVHSIPLSLPLTRICGVSGDRIYLAGQNPQFVMVLDGSLNRKEVLSFNIPLTEKLLTGNVLLVDSPEIRLFANNEGRVYLAGINKKTVDSLQWDKRVFTHVAMIGKNLAVSRGFDKSATGQVFTLFDLAGGGRVLSQKTLLDDPNAGFATDGLLKYDEASHRIIYMQYYENIFLCLDTALNLVYTGHTIDTTRTNQVRVEKLNSAEGEKWMPVTPRLAVLKDCYPADGWIYTLSGLKADNESANGFRNNSVVDVYRVLDGAYKGSFYLPKPDGDQLFSIAVHKDRLIALYEKHLETYRLNWR